MPSEEKKVHPARKGNCAPGPIRALFLIGDAMLIIERVLYNEHGFAWTERIKLTGRWKIEWVDDDCTLYLEYKGWFFRYWVHENSIKITNVLTYINRCGDEGD